MKHVACISKTSKICCGWCNTCQF